VLRNGSTPIALVHRDRSWSLELYELARVDRCVYRPRRRRIEGRLAILSFLRTEDAAGSLSGVTERLMRRHAGVDCAFDGLNGGWLPQGTQARFAGAHLPSEAAEAPALSESATVR